MKIVSFKMCSYLHGELGLNYTLLDFTIHDEQFRPSYGSETSANSYIVTIRTGS